MSISKRLWKRLWAMDVWYTDDCDYWELIRHDESIVLQQTLLTGE